MAFLAELAATENLTYHRSFSRQYVYSDVYNEKPTKVVCTNSDLNFTGAVTSLRLKYKSKYNFRGKYAVISTSGFKSDKEKAALDSRYGSPKEHEFICILNLDDFLKVFSAPAKLAEFLRGKAELVCSQWNQLNSSPDKVGKRKPVGANYTLSKFEWKPSRGSRVEEKSNYNLELSSYSATFKHLNDENFKISVQDLKVHIKLRSTTTKDFPDTSSELEGMSYDSYGFSCNALHFFGLLENPSFATFVEEVAEVNSSYCKEVADTAAAIAGVKRRRVESPSSSSNLLGAAAPGGEYQDDLADD